MFANTRNHPPAIEQAVAPVAIEQLEARALLSASVTLTDGDLVVAGTSSADEVEFFLNHAGTQVKVVSFSTGRIHAAPIPMASSGRRAKPGLVRSSPQRWPPNPSGATYFTFRGLSAACTADVASSTIANARRYGMKDLMVSTIAPVFLENVPRISGE